MNHTRKSPILIVLGLSILFSLGVIYLLLQSENPTDAKGTLKGTVVDATTGTPIPGVKVTATDQDGVQYTKQEESDTTGADGFFKLELPPDDYTLTFEADGYLSFTSFSSYKITKGKSQEISEAFRLVADSTSPGGGPDEGEGPGGELPPQGEIAEGESIEGGIAEGGSAEGGIAGEGSAEEGSAVSEPSTVEYTILCIGPSNEVLDKISREGGIGAEITENPPSIAGYRADTAEQKILLSENSANNILRFYYSEDPLLSPEVNIPEDALRYQGHSYYVYRTSSISSFWEAEDYCESIGGHLAVINNDTLNQVLYRYVFDTMGYESAYFGLTDDGSENNWYWVTGEPYSYQKWENGQPDNKGGYENYALFYYKDGRYKWNDGDFGPDKFGTVTFLIEWDTQ